MLRVHDMKISGVGDYSGYEGGKAGVSLGPQQSQPTEGSNMSVLELLSCEALAC